MTVLRLQRFGGAGYMLGFALGGFADGILLHQILQWHHLLSAVDNAPFDDIRTQILADGMFHAAMYAVALMGLWRLSQARRLLHLPSADRLLAADALVGFGGWHVVDAVLSHWLLGIHRIRMDVPDPLFWDLLWFFVFGVMFIALGLLLRARAFTTRSSLKGLAAPALAAAVLAGAAGAARAPETSTVTVLLRPGVPPVQLLSALRDMDASLVWNSARGDVWVVKMSKKESGYRLYAHGALLVSGTLLPAGCSSWIRS